MSIEFLELMIKYWSVIQGNGSNLKADADEVLLKMGEADHQTVNSEENKATLKIRIHNKLANELYIKL